MRTFFKIHWLIIVVVMLALIPIQQSAAQEPSQSQAINFGQNMSGSIGYQNTSDEWEFTGQAGDTISVVMRGTGGLDSFLRLLDEQSRIIATNDDYAGTDAALINFVLPTSGTFTIQASAFGKTTGSYTLHLLRGTPPQTTIMPSQVRSISNGILDYGGYAQGIINETRPFESWQFNGRQGETVSISMSALDSSTTTLDPFLYLYDPNGNRIAINDDNGNSLNAKILIRLPSNGTYTIFATTYKQQTLGTYWLFLNRENLAAPIGDDREPVITAPPSTSTRLGGLDVQDYCSDQGYVAELVNQRRHWACVEPDNQLIVFVLGQSDFDAICQSTYANQSAFAVLNGTSATPAYNWNCYGFNVVQNPSPQPSSRNYIGTLTPRYGVEVQVRAGPGTNYDSLGVIDWRETYPLILQNGEWYLIDFNGRPGYVSTRWATVTMDDEAAVG